MPHVGTSSASDADLASSDEIKVFKDEGGEGDEGDKRSSAGLGDDDLPASNEIDELKHSLIDEDERERSSKGPTTTTSTASKVPMVGGPHPGSPLSFMMHNMEAAFPQPPPAHMGIPTVHIDPKTGISRAPWGNLTSAAQYSPAVFPDFTQGLQWHMPSMYPMSSTAFRGAHYPTSSTALRGSHYPTSLTPTGSGFTRFTPPTLLPPYPVPGLSPYHPFLTGGSKHHHDLAAAMAAASSLSQSHLENGRMSLPAYATAASQSHHHHHHHPHHHPHHHLEHHLQQPSTHLASSHHHLGLGPESKSSLSRLSSNGSSATSGIWSPARDSTSHRSVSSPGSDCKPKQQNGHGGGGGGHQSRADQNGGQHKSVQSPGSNQQHVKKPLNAFMLFMKEQRTQVVNESLLKESAAINQILGKRWHSLSREEQSKYYDMARKERQLHMQLYPGWTARDNYAINQKKKKKKRDKSSDGEGGALKKCRARYGLDQQSSWCKPCRRKKKCIRYMDSELEGYNLGSAGSVEAPTPDSKSANESDADNHLLS